MSNHDNKIIELETKLAYQEDTLNKLSDEFYKQQKQIETLERQHQALMGKLKELQHSNGQSANTIIDEKPPHY